MQDIMVTLDQRTITSSYCPRNASRTFLAAFTENKVKDSDAPKTPTVLFCNSTYYYLEVRATVGLPDNNIINMTAIGDATELLEDMFNTTALERQMSSQSQENNMRGEIPGSVARSDRNAFHDGYQPLY